MIQPPSSRPPNPLDPDDSHAARLGTEIRTRRKAGGLTLKALASMIGFSLQHLSEVERAKAPMSGRFVAACDLALEAGGSLLEMFEAVVCERAMQRQEQSVARQRSEGELPDAEYEALTSALRLTRYAGQEHPSEAGEDVDLSRRSLIGAGVGAALGLDVTTASALARPLDPGLAEYWTTLLRVLARHDAMFGPHDALGTVRHSLDLLAEHRQTASGELRTQLVSVESRWSWFAGALCNDSGDWRRRDVWTDRALRLAQEAGDQDMVAWVLMWQSRWAAMRPEPQTAILLADAAGRTPGISKRIRGLCALRAAQGHALANDTASCERSLADAHGLLDQTAQSEHLTLWEDLGRQDDGVSPYVLAAEARCWLQLHPARAIGMLEEVLRLWPQDRTRGRGIHHARLALACAADNEPERAAAEGVKAVEIVRTTKSDVTVRELKRLDQDLAGFDTPAAADFREMYAVL
jgi:transcriptional regulator with XRE-family HTH domain